MTVQGGAAEAPALRLPADRTYDKAAGSPGPVRFSHATRLRDAGGPAAGSAPQVNWATLDAEFFARGVGT